jgi:hypothetical protein
MTLEDRIKSCISRHPDWDDRRIASAIRGSSRTAVRAVRAGRPIPEEVHGWPLEPAGQDPEAGHLTLADVRKRYDTAQAIRDEILAAKPGILISERELCLKVCGRDMARFRRAVENAEDLKGCRVKLRLDTESREGIYYWGRKADVAEAIRLRDE